MKLLEVLELLKTAEISEDMTRHEVIESVIEILDFIVFDDSENYVDDVDDDDDDDDVDVDCENALISSLKSMELPEGISHKETVSALFSVLNDAIGGHYIRRDLYPVMYKDRLWDESDCGDVFRGFYTCAEAISGGSVYVSNGMRVFPDDSFEGEK